MPSSPDRDDTGGIKTEDKFEHITEKAMRHSLLQRLISERLFVTVVVEGSKERFNSTVLELTDKGLLLDELYPEHGQQLIHEGSSLRIYARMDRQASLFFDALVAEVGEEEGMGFYRLQEPETLNYLQRRAHFRVPVGRVEKIPVRLEREDGGVIEGLLYDLSSGGASSIIIDHPLSEQLSEGEVFVSCRLEPVEEGPLEVSAELRRIETGRESGEQILGLSFNIEDPRTEQRLNRLVHRLERQLLRHRYVV